MSYLKIYGNGNKYWYNEEGKLHREDGPAIELSDGTKYWYLNDKIHREDGPAAEYSSNNNDKAWYYNEKYIGSSWTGFTQEDFERYLRSLKIKEYW